MLAGVGVVHAEHAAPVGVRHRCALVERQDVVAVSYTHLYGAENSFDGFTVADGETVDLSYTPVANAGTYDLVLLTANDSKIAVRKVKLADAKDISFHFEEGVGYASYTDAKSGQTIDNRAEALDAEDDAAVVPQDLETQKG